MILATNLSFCKTTFFPELSSPKLIKDKIEKKNLNELISGENKLSDYSYEYFITYTPDQTGNTQTANHNKLYQVPLEVIFLKEQLIKIQVHRLQLFIIFTLVVVTQINHPVIQTVM